ncbi:NAD(P)/FAD-dependent oxidoreductase [Ferrimonas sp. SCSIO 43195]|uniref:flavin-containing monooxygenase n=1 Tax=Ferrimonas sp. SCSIO 43195 TaxID=2822844 RepID=UPI0020751BF8|nr:NAD(P)/FAD-dependent oxidoreductase [Ferrimonas sp. SCSIO 43195]USD35665.1 NAD(P)/FAD-dependent oxidoreductase [Ferrimonas sp. SCSIO 43195]
MTQGGTKPHTTGEQRQPRVVIAGAGMTGILTAITLRQAGIRDLLILEKRSSLGGTWRENRYPGVACDVPSHFYSYSFAPNPDWQRRFASGEEIQAYFERVFHTYGLGTVTRFNQQLVHSEYRRGRWHLKTDCGHTYQADFFVCATGILHHPCYPNIRGLDSFEGACFHTARWPQSAPVDGTRVGVIGTGSTACQLIPALADRSQHISVFQRTPQWIMRLSNPGFGPTTRLALRRLPSLQRLVRWSHQLLLSHLFSKAVIGRKVPHWIISTLCKLNLKFSVRDPVLRRKLTPDYTVGCKRLIINSEFYRAVQRDTVSLETAAIRKVVPKGVVTDDGKLHRLDTLILATGFRPFEFMRPMVVIGEGGVTIEQQWRHKVQAYRSLLIPGFPNLFLMLGPNTPIGNFSVIAMSEVQVNYLLQLIQQWQQRRFDAVSARTSAMEAFNQSLKAGMKGTVWLGGCQSWYLDKDGDPAMWPFSWQRWVDEMAAPQMDHLRLHRYGNG